MTKAHSSRGALLTANLPQLQNLIKRDPPGYRDEFLQQWSQFQSVMLIFEHRPDEQAERFREMVTFIAQVAQCYPQETAGFPTQISSLLLRNFTTLAPDTRKTLVQNLVMLRNKGVVSSIELLKTLFPLLARTTSSSLRSFIRNTILLDIRTANQKAQNHKLNRAIQAMLFGMLERGMESEMVGDKGKLRERPADAPKQSMDEAVWAVSLTKELWKRGVWNDEKTVSIVALACFHPSTKAEKAAYYFFLGDEDEESNSSEDEDEGPDIRQMKHQRSVKKKSRSEDRKIAKAMKVVKKKTKNKNEKVNTNFSALQLLRDPQTFAEKLYDHLQRYDKRFSLDHKILIMQLLSRIMGYHKLCVLGFYGYVVKYLTYHQLRVTVILGSLAQSVHDLTPPDVLSPVVRKLAHEFVHPGVGPEVIAAGLNAVREICRRQPWSMEEDLLGDLVEYRKSRDKSVMVAARSLLQLYREVNPVMLKRRERGKAASTAQHVPEPLPYGHFPTPASGIEGLELLQAHVAAHEGESEDNSEQWEGWDVESDSDESSSSGSWIAVSSDDDNDIVVSDSEEEANPILAAASSVPPPAPTENLATTKILTPADFAMLNKLKAEASTANAKPGSRGTKRKATSEENKGDQDAISAFVSEAEIMGPRKRAKASYAERVASIQEGREGREKFGSKKGMKAKDVPSSTTNRQKARNKPIMMILSSNAVRGKKRASLREKQLRLRKGKRG